MDIFHIALLWSGSFIMALISLTYFRRNGEPKKDGWPDMTPYKNITDIPAYRRAQGRIGVYWAFMYFLGGLLIFFGAIPSNSAPFVFLLAVPFNLVANKKINNKYKTKETDTNG